MKIVENIEFAEFTAWGQGRDTHDIIWSAGKCAEAEALIEELYPEGLSEMALNDLLWCDADWLLEKLGIESEEGLLIVDDSRE